MLELGPGPIRSVQLLHNRLYASCGQEIAVINTSQYTIETKWKAITESVTIEYFSVKPTTYPTPSLLTNYTVIFNWGIAYETRECSDFTALSITITWSFISLSCPHRPHSFVTCVEVSPDTLWTTQSRSPIIHLWDLDDGYNHRGEVNCDIMLRNL